MHCRGIDLLLKMPKVRLLDQARASIFTYQIVISSKIMVHILFLVKGVIAKDLEPVLIRH